MNTKRKIIQHDMVVDSPIGRGITCGLVFQNRRDYMPHRLLINLGHKFEESDIPLIYAVKPEDVEG